MAQSSKYDFSRSDKSTICVWYFRSDAPLLQIAAREEAAKRSIRCFSDEDSRLEAAAKEREETERKRFLARLNDTSVRFLNWKERIDRVVQDELRRWLSIAPEGVEEIAPP